MSNNGNYKNYPYTINSTANSVMSKVVEDVISDNFCLWKFPPKKKKKKRGEGQKMKILAL